MTLHLQLELGQKLRAARKAKGLTLQEVKAATGVSVTAISESERGLHMPRADHLQKVCEFYGIDSKELFARKYAVETVREAQPMGGTQEDLDEHIGFAIVVNSLRSLSCKSPGMQKQIERGLRMALKEKAADCVLRGLVAMESAKNER